MAEDESQSPQDKPDVQPEQSRRIPTAEEIEAEEQARASGDMSFLEHLDELRGVILRSAIAFVVAAVLMAVFLRQAADLLNWPLNVALGNRHAEAAGELARGLGQLQLEGLITTGPMGVFAVILQVTFIGGIVLALPFMLYFLARFIAPGLTKKELAVLRPGVLAALILFLVGATFSFFVLVPGALRASIFFNEMFGYTILWTADKYYGLLMWMVLGVGLTFEFPLLIIVFNYLGFVTAQQLREWRPYAAVVFLAIAAVVTPTQDPVTFLLLAVPMWVLYELSVLVCARLQRVRRAQQEEEA